MGKALTAAAERTVEVLEVPLRLLAYVCVSRLSSVVFGPRTRRAMVLLQLRRLVGFARTTPALKEVMSFSWNLRICAHQ